MNTTCVVQGSFPCGHALEALFLAVSGNGGLHHLMISSLEVLFFEMTSPIMKYSWRTTSFDDS